MRNAQIDSMNGGFRAPPRENSEQRYHSVIPVADATVPYRRSGELHWVDSYRSSATLPEECDIAIIGAGFSGVSTAYHLSQLYEERGEKPNIVLVEAREVCSGATGRNGGHAKIGTKGILKTIKSYGLAAGEELWAFFQEHLYALKHVVETEEIDCEFELRRSFDVFLAEREAEEVRREFTKCIDHEWTKDIGLVNGRFVEQLTSIKGAKFALSLPICSFWPYKLVSQLLGRLIERDAVSLQTNTTVYGVDAPDSAGVTKVHTSRGWLRATRVIFATNAYTVGVLPQYKGKIIPYKGTASHLVSESERVSPHLSNTYNIHFSPGFDAKVDYLNPRPDGSVVVGGGQWTYNQDRSAWYNVWDDSTLLPAAKSHFNTVMQRNFRGWDEGAVVEEMWTGIQGLTPDGYPFVGEVPGRKGWWISAGFNGCGNALCWLCGKGIAKMIVKDLPFSHSGVPKLFEPTAERMRLEAPQE